MVIDRCNDDDDDFYSVFSTSLLYDDDENDSNDQIDVQIVDEADKRSQPRKVEPKKSVLEIPARAASGSQNV